MPARRPPEGGYDARTRNWRLMKVRIGISHTDKLVELEVDDADAFRKEIEGAVAAGGLREQAQGVL